MTSPDASVNTRQIYVFAFLFVLFVVAAFVLPKIVVGSETGLAAGATAAVTFLAFSALAFLVAIYLFIFALLKRGALSKRAFVTALLPLPTAIVVGLLVWILVTI